MLRFELNAKNIICCYLTSTSMKYNKFWLSYSAQSGVYLALLFGAELHSELNKLFKCMDSAVNLAPNATRHQMKVLGKICLSFNIRSEYIDMIRTKWV